MPFDLIKANAALANLRLNFQTYEKKEDGLVGKQSQRMRLVKEAADEMARRVAELRSLGVDGGSFADFKTDKEIKQQLEVIEALLQATELDSTELAKLLATFEKEIDALVKAANKEAASQSKKKGADSPRPGRRDQLDVAELAQAAAALQEQFASTFKYRLAWTSKKMRETADGILRDVFKGIDSVARQDTIDEMKRRLEPRLIVKRRNEARVAFEKIVQIAKAQSSSGSPSGSSPLAGAAGRQDAAKEAAALLNELKSSADELSASLASVDEGKILPLRDSPQREGRQLYADFMAAKDALQGIVKLSEQGEKVVKALGGGRF